MRYFFCGSFMFFLSCDSYAFVRICLYVPCGHLLGKGWPLGSRLWCLTVSLLLSHWYPGSGVVLSIPDLCTLQLTLDDPLQDNFEFSSKYLQQFSRFGEEKNLHLKWSKEQNLKKVQARVIGLAHDKLSHTPIMFHQNILKSFPLTELTRNSI